MTSSDVRSNRNVLRRYHSHRVCLSRQNQYRLSHVKTFHYIFLVDLRWRESRQTKQNVKTIFVFAIFSARHKKTKQRRTVHSWKRSKTGWLPWRESRLIISKRRFDFYYEIDFFCSLPEVSSSDVLFEHSQTKRKVNKHLKSASACSTDLRRRNKTRVTRVFRFTATIFLPRFLLFMLLLFFCCCFFF